MNLFDGLAKNAFGTVAEVMGYTAIWQPDDGSDIQTARVLFRDPSTAQKVGSVEYMPNQYVMEYRLGDFQGMKELADNNDRPRVTIEGRDYFAVYVEAIADGRTFRATLEPCYDIRTT
jgi:hypothetical protein